MKINVFGATLQAGVLAGLFAEHGHQVFWCSNELGHKDQVHYQNEDVNRLIQQQLISGFLHLGSFDELPVDNDVYVFSYAATEQDRTLALLDRIHKITVEPKGLFINGSTFGLHGTEALKQKLNTENWAYLPDVIQEGNALGSFTYAKQVIVGVDHDDVKSMMQELLRPFFQFQHQYLFMPILE